MFTNPVYYDDDANVSDIEDETIAILGYGGQGHAQAQNLADSGNDVVAGLPEESASREAASNDGLFVATPAKAAAAADRIVMLVPDTVQPDLHDQIKDGLEPGTTLQLVVFRLADSMRRLRSSRRLFLA